MNITVKTGDVVTVSGYYIYKKSPNYGEIPQYPFDEKRILVLNKGDIVPQFQSHDGLYKLVTEK